MGISEERSNNNVTLFFGLAGIGYELLRFTDHIDLDQNLYILLRQAGMAWSQEVYETHSYK